MTTTTVTARHGPPPGTRPGAVVAGFGNEIHKAMLDYAAGWRATAAQLVMFPAFYLIIALFMGCGQLRADLLAAVLFGFVPYVFTHEQLNRMFWSYLGDIQSGVLEQTYLTPLPAWTVILGRQLAAMAAGLPLAAAIYLTGIIATRAEGAALPAHPAASGGHRRGHQRVRAGHRRTDAGVQTPRTGPGHHHLHLVRGRRRVRPAPRHARLGRWRQPPADPLHTRHRSRTRHPAARPHPHHPAHRMGLGWLLAQPIVLIAAGAVAFTLLECLARRRGTLGRC